jgi:hypothetical protein
MPFTGTAEVDGRVMSIDKTQSDKDSLLTYAILLRQQHRMELFTEFFELFTRGEEGEELLRDVRVGQLWEFGARIEKGTKRNTVLIADRATEVSEIEQFKRKFELSGQLQDCESRPMWTPTGDGEEMAELTIVGQRDGDDVSVCAKAFKDRVEDAEKAKIDAHVQVTGTVKTYTMQERRVTGLHLATIEEVAEFGSSSESGE